MLTDDFYDDIKRRVRIAPATCPCCGIPAELDEKKVFSCCGVTAEAVLVIDPPPVEPIMVKYPNQIRSFYAMEPVMMPDPELRKAYIGYLPLENNAVIALETFHAIIDYQIPLPPCPRCQKTLSFRKDQDETEKPFCEGCVAFFPPSHHQKGSLGTLRHFCEIRKDPIVEDEFEFNTKAYNAEYVEPKELRSVGRAAYWQAVAMFAADFVKSVLETSEVVPDAIIDTTENTTTEDPLTYFIRTRLVKNTKGFAPRDALYSAYEKSCEDPETCVTRNAFFKQIRTQLGVKDGRKSVEGKIVRGFDGIAFRT